MYMARRYSRVDDYIANAAPFARPILTRLRAMVHAAGPDVDEGIRWGAPTFLHDGKILCSMAAFKAHVTFGFWRAERVLAHESMTVRADREAAMGQFGRLTRLDELPTQQDMDRWIAAAIAVAEGGPAPVAKARAVKPAPGLPADFATALAAVPVAQAAFDRFPPGQRRDYIEWVTEARRADTRARLIAQAVDWIAEGRPRN